MPWWNILEVVAHACQIDDQSKECAPLSCNPQTASCPGSAWQQTPRAAGVSAPSDRMRAKDQQEDKQVHFLSRIISSRRDQYKATKPALKSRQASPSAPLFVSLSQEDCPLSNTSVMTQASHCGTPYRKPVAAWLRLSPRGPLPLTPLPRANPSRPPCTAAFPERPPIIFSVAGKHSAKLLCEPPREGCLFLSMHSESYLSCSHP